MCLALPGQIVAINGVQADVKVGDVVRKAGLQLQPDARCGDYVLVKTGLVVEVLTEADAKDLMSFFADMVAALDEPDAWEELEAARERT